MIIQYNRFLTDYLACAEEIVLFIQELEDEGVSAAKTGRGYVNSVNETRQCDKRCQVGHISSCYREKSTARDLEKKKSSRECWETTCAFVANASDDWILDTGTSFHLVGDLSMLIKAEDCASHDELR